MQTRTSRPTSSDDGPRREVGLKMKDGRGRRTLPTAAVGDEELQVKLVLRDVGSNDAVHRLTGTPELWGLPASPHSTPRSTLRKPQRAEPARNPARRCRSREEAGCQPGYRPLEKGTSVDGQNLGTRRTWTCGWRHRRRTPAPCLRRSV